MPRYRRNSRPGRDRTSQHARHARRPILTTDIGRKASAGPSRPCGAGGRSRSLGSLLNPTTCTPSGPCRPVTPNSLRWLRIKEEFTEAFLAGGGSEGPRSRPANVTASAGCGSGGSGSTPFGTRTTWSAAGPPPRLQPARAWTCLSGSGTGRGRRSTGTWRAATTHRLGGPACWLLTSPAEWDRWLVGWDERTVRGPRRPTIPPTVGPSRPLAGPLVPPYENGMATTSIEWTEATWNPLTGCTKISPGCKHCYAERMASGSS